MPPTPSRAASPSAPVPTSPTLARIAALDAAVAANPADSDASRDLGFALLQRIRETADPSLYAPAEAAFEAARRLAPDDAQVYVGIGGLQLGKHQFADALKTGRTAVALSPGLDTAHAVVVDALVELGRYDEAQTAADAMLGSTLDLTTLTRASYLAELHGELIAALAAMRMAATSPSLAPENIAFVDAITGNLLVYAGDPAGAAKAYDDALALVPTHAPSIAGQARLAVGAGDLARATELYQRAADILPLPEYIIGLGETLQAAGRTDEAARSFKLARAEISLFQASGVSVDLDLALFEADHGDPATALAFAQDAYDATPTIRAADALAWALHRLGRDAEARTRSDEALRLGSHDPLFHYHAGAIAAAVGDDATAGTDLALALSTDPGFSATGAAEARRILASLR
jgi:tetratricopeptide (TPR) repeat protein